MSQKNVEVVKRAVSAVNERDIDRYLACCTENVELQTPLAAVGGAYEGPAAIRRFFADIEDTGPDFRLELERWRQSARTASSPSCVQARAGERAASPPHMRRRTSTTSSTGRSGASESSSTANRPSKPWGCEGRPRL